MNDEDPTEPAVEIEGIAPDRGDPDGGTAVTITGRGFDGEVTVKFGNATVPATRIDAGTLTVEAPFSGFEESVDVTVIADRGQDVVEDGFTYTRDVEDTGDSGDTGVGPTGKVGGVVELSLLQIACPECFGVTSDIDVAASAAFHQPANGSWTSWLPSPGSCVADPAQGGPTATRLDVGEWVYLQSGSRSISLHKTTSDGVIYTASGLTNEDYARSATYNVSAPDGGDLGDFDVANAVSTPQGFTSITPNELLYVDPADAFAATVRRSGSTTFTWAPSGGSGTFVVVVAAYHPTSGAYLGSIWCRDADNGSMTIPGSAFTAYPANSLLAVYLWRYQISEWVLPGNGATVESIATVGVVGTATLR